MQAMGMMEGNAQDSEGEIGALDSQPCDLSWRATKPEKEKLPNYSRLSLKE